jgi:threonine synthase
VRALVARGVIGRDDRVVAVLTGHLLKDPGVDASAAAAAEALTPAEALALLQRVVAP